MRQKKISLLYALITLLWQLPTFGLSLLISNGTNDTRLIFIIETYIGHAIIVGCVSSFMTTYWFLLASLADRFYIVNKCLRYFKLFLKRTINNEEMFQKTFKGKTIRLAHRLQFIIYIL